MLIESKAIVCKYCKVFTSDFVGLPEYKMLTSTSWEQTNAICIDCDFGRWDWAFNPWI